MIIKTAVSAVRFGRWAQRERKKESRFFLRCALVLWNTVFQNLKTKLQDRRSRILACSHQEFLAYSKQFFAFVEQTPALRALVTELLARNGKVSERAKAEMGPQVHFAVGAPFLGNTDEEAATIAYVHWSAFAGQESPHAFFMDAAGGMDGSLRSYRQWYVIPLFGYLQEALENGNVILDTLIRYKHKVEWYRRTEVLALYKGDTSRGETLLKKHMFEFLFDQGLPFHVEPKSASGEPDVVSLDDSEQPFIGDAKVFNGSNRPNIKKAFHQVHQYCADYNKAVGYLIVFNVSPKQLRVELPSQPGGIPRFEYNHRTIFLVSIDTYEHEGTASTRGIPETVTISEDELVQEVMSGAEPSTQV